MTEIMPVPRNLSFTVLPAERLDAIFLFTVCGLYFAFRASMYSSIGSLEKDRISPWNSTNCCKSIRYAFNVLLLKLRWVSHVDRYLVASSLLITPINSFRFRIILIILKNAVAVDY